MELPSTPLVLTKLRVPTVRPRLVPRPRLLENLSSDSRPNLILVCAPSGYGKTTLLADWAHNLLTHGVCVAWYALDSSDDDPVPFAAYLVDSFIQALGPISGLAQLAQLLRSSPELDLSHILPTLINTLASSGRDCLLVMDDYHLVTSPAIHSAMAFLLERLPPNLHLAIGSRADPPLQLARLRARGQLLELRASGLRFTPDETDRFLNESMGLDLSPSGVAVLVEKTEGWIAGLQLAALSLAGRTDREGFIATFTGGHRYLVEYLLEEVVDRQPDEIRSFLLATSILERMCAPLCDALPGSASQGESILRQLDQANLFLVALDDQGIWYRYHRLFRDFLQTRLSKAQPSHINVLHRAACEWLAAHSYLREAAAHAFQTNDWDYAAAFVEQHSFTLILHSEIATIYEWCSVFPESVMQAHPMLCLQQGLALAYRFQLKNRPRIEARLQQVDRHIASMTGSPDTLGLAQLVAVVRTFQAMAPDPAVESHGLLALSRQMLDGYSGQDAGRFSGLLVAGYASLALCDTQTAYQSFESARQIALGEHLYFGVVESTFHLARLAHAQGHLDLAAGLCRQGLADIAALLPHPEQELPALGSLEVALGGVLLDQGHLDEAQDCLLHGLDLMGWSMNPYYLMIAYGAFFRLYEVRRQPAEALACLSRLDELWPDVAFYIGALRVRLALWTDPQSPVTLEQASAWCLDTAPILHLDFPPPGLGPIGAAEAFYQARLAWIHAQIVLGHPQAARSVLDPLLERSLSSGLAGRVVELSFLQALAARATDGGRVAPSGMVETVSQRELEVLHLMAQGATNQAIAARLVITVGTVKSHINHILGKLDAHNRTEAVARARLLGLI